MAREGYEHEIKTVFCILYQTCFFLLNLIPRKSPLASGPNNLLTLNLNAMKNTKNRSSSRRYIHLSKSNYPFDARHGHLAM